MLPMSLILRIYFKYLYFEETFGVFCRRGNADFNISLVSSLLSVHLSGVVFILIVLTVSLKVTDFLSQKIYSESVVGDE